ncbi:MAG: fatty acid desaturase [Roseovarius sp.]|nr:fatty acid desaturase [Roseovarius sp.]
MNHREFAASLPRDELARLNETNDAAGLRHLAGHAGIIIVSGLWIGMGLPLWQIMLVPHGVFICFLFTLEHEATHKTPFASAWINEWAGRMCGFAIFLPFEWFRYFHLAHHRWTNIPGKDPELADGSRPETVAAYILYVSGLPYWLGMAKRTFFNAIGRDLGEFVPNRARRRVVIESRIMLTCYVLAGISLLATDLLFWIWILPCLLGQPLLRLYLLAEHGHCALVANMLENTRTTYTNGIIRRLAWNMPYHVEHHTLPQVPFHKLPELNFHMTGWHRVTSDGYVNATREYARKLDL